ncbi:MAG: iron-sulfur cluster assembly protein [Gammaproteobacteria bacterium]|jgi:FeS assembly SUF system protein
MSDAYVHFQTTPGQELADLPADAPLHDKLVAALRSIYDPELPVNIYDLGLIYELDIQGKDVNVVMTLTTPNCPVAGSMPARVESVLGQIPGIGKVSVRLTWDPPWNIERLSDEVKLTLGLL